MDCSLNNKIDTYDFDMHKKKSQFQVPELYRTIIIVVIGIMYIFPKTSLNQGTK